MATLNLIITTAGQAALAQAGTIGPVVISKVAVGSGTWTTPPTPSATALLSEIKQLDPSGAETPSAGIIHITATDNSADVYNVYEMGLYTSTGILFAIAGGTTLFLNKASGSSALFSIDLAITNVPSGSVVIGDAGFAYPPATETTQGVAEIATSAEVIAGTDDTRIVTPKKLADGNFLSKSGGTVAGTLNVTGALQKNGTPLLGLYDVSNVAISSLSGYVKLQGVGKPLNVTGFWSSGWYVSGGATHLTYTLTVPSNEIWEIENTFSFFVDSNDYLTCAMVKNNVAQYEIANASYGNSGVVKIKDVLTSGTYVFSWKSLLGVNGGADTIYFCSTSGSVVDLPAIYSRTIHKYKTA